MRIRKEINIEQEKSVIQIARISSALAHPLRIALFHYVKSNNGIRNDICNKDLVQHFDYSQSSLSQHIKVLKEAQLFEVVYKDKFSFYFYNSSTYLQYIEALKNL